MCPHRTLHSVTNFCYRVDKIVYMGEGERLQVFLNLVSL